MTKPLAIDLFTGLHGWSEGLIAEGFRVVGYDIEDMSAQFNCEKPEHFKLVLQDVLTIHGSQFKDATLIVASPPCQEYSYMAMPWSLAKAKAAAIRADTTGESLVRLNRLFNACFRIQAEASLAAGRYIPLVVENVKGAQPWVGRARWNFGSFYLWGDVPALMPGFERFMKNGGGGSWFGINPDGTPGALNNARDGVKAPGMNWSDPTKRGQDFTRLAGRHAAAQETGTKLGGNWFQSYSPGTQGPRNHGSNSKGRKMASAMIAKIPEPLCRHIAKVYRP